MLNSFRDVYNQMLLFLSALAALGVYTFGMPALLNVAAAVSIAALLDAGVNYYKFKKLELPKSGVISGFFVALILPFNPLYAAAGAAIAIASKHIIRFNKRHVFNPAAFGITAAMLLFSAAASWWVATTWLLVPLGLLIVYSIRRWRTAAAFLGAYALLSIGLSIVRFGLFPDAFRVLDLTLLFFALFMVIEPRTTPHRTKAMLAFGALVALASVGLRELGAPTDSLLAAMLLGNLFTSTLNKKLG
ncbi:MAG: RnfABCDGE type electron transport complex subunit D [Candidatus Aenigmarchaeota archaeon]|nr:RnfABCDGE type electron transport complex subunit D [Candidatus Aenigmarchaeota archaeon]